MYKHAALRTILLSTLLFTPRVVAQEPPPTPSSAVAEPTAPAAPAQEPQSPPAAASVEPVPAASPVGPSNHLDRATAPSLTIAPPHAPQAATAAPPGPPAQIVSMSARGLTVQSEDAHYAFNIRFPFMFDFKSTLNNSQPANGDAFYPRFFGPIFTVTLHKAVTGKLIVGFQNRSVGVVNAWFDVAAHPLLHLRLGKFLYPISLERQTLPLRIVMLEHGIASTLLPVSEFGAQLWGALPDKLFEYQLTFGNGAYANQHYEVDLDKGKDLIGRLYLRPFARTDIAALKGFGIGFGASWGKHRNQSGTTLTGAPATLGGRTFFNTLVSQNANDPSTTVFSAGPVVRLVPQLSYTAGPVSLYAEYIRVSERLKKGAARDTFTHQSAHAVLAAVVTGENAVLLDWPAPKRPFDWSAGQFGALELVANVEGLQYDEDVFPEYANPARSAQKALAYGGGFNWYPTEIIRVMVNYEHTEFGAVKGVKKLRAEELLAVRVQALF